MPVPPGAAAAPPPVGGLPAYFEFVAPTAWRRIDFVSDLHLSEAMPRTCSAWSDYLRRTDADAVFILGDLFELWVGDDAVSLDFERGCVERLAEAASHRQLAFMVGNRDFLVGTAMLRTSGMMGLPDPSLLVAWGQRVLLSHGDALCLDDHPYQAFRRQVRDPKWQAQVLARPLAERQQLGVEMRRASAARSRFDGDASIDIDAGEAVRWMHAMGAAEMVHGHTHRPGSNALAPGFKRHVLSDWDLDTADRAEVLRLTRDGFARLPLAAV
jgi:UDP-2,3-diacylglucosamine hydrolase